MCVFSTWENVLPDFRRQRPIAELRNRAFRDFSDAFPNIFPDLRARPGNVPFLSITRDFFPREPVGWSLPGKDIRERPAGSAQSRDFISSTKMCPTPALRLGIDPHSGQNTERAHGWQRQKKGRVRPNPSRSRPQPVHTRSAAAERLPPAGPDGRAGGIGTRTGSSTPSIGPPPRARRGGGASGHPNRSAGRRRGRGRGALRQGRRGPALRGCRVWGAPLGPGLPAGLHDPPELPPSYKTSAAAVLSPGGGEAPYS